MNIKKSLTIALAQRNMKKQELAEALNVDPRQVSMWQSRNSTTLAMMQAISSTLDMKLSEFIALGED